MIRLAIPIIILACYASSDVVVFDNAKRLGLPPLGFKFVRDEEGRWVGAPNNGIKNPPTLGRNVTMGFGKLSDDFDVSKQARMVSQVEVIAYVVTTPDIPSGRPRRSIVKDTTKIDYTTFVPVQNGSCEIRSNNPSGPVVAKGKFLKAEKLPYHLSLSRPSSRLMGRKLQRVVFKFENVKLNPGKYWFVYDCATKNPNSTVFSPKLYGKNGHSLPGANATAIQSKDSGSGTSDTPFELNLVVKGNEPNL